MVLKSGYQKTFFKYMSGNCPFSQDVSALMNEHNVI
uniref:Glutaredoxin domain-containing protein n=1 Tax=Heterorhabditis bacteriophora TaxID=37862 RepID=A0A1I7WBB3_HETBA